LDSTSIGFSIQPTFIVADTDVITIEAIRLVAIWLLRHMIWENCRRYVTPGIWIGSAVPILSFDFPKVIDPNGHCRCGKQVEYKKCHMTQDLSSVPSLSTAKPSNYETISLANKHKQHTVIRLFAKEAYGIYGTRSS
jgi:hypothetical protein